MAEINKASLLDTVWPKGSIFVTTKSGNDGNPNLLFGGSWSQITDKFLMSSNPNTSLPEGIYQHSHSTSSTTLTTSNLPKHTHTVTIIENGSHTHTKLGYSNGAGGSNRQAVTYDRITTDPNNENFGLQSAGSHSHQMSVTGVGGGQSHNHGNTSYVSNIPKYYAVFMWQRTA